MIKIYNKDGMSKVFIVHEVGCSTLVHELLKQKMIKWNNNMTRLDVIKGCTYTIFDRNTEVARVMLHENDFMFIED